MLDILKTFLNGLAGPAESVPASRPDDPRLAAAALLVHAVRVDGAVDPDEKAVIERILAERFDLDAAAVATLIDDASAAEREAVDLYRFTSLLKRRLDPEGRLATVEMLWEAVLADGNLHEFEDNVVWRIAELLDVGTRDRVLARKKVEARRGSAESD